MKRRSIYPIEASKYLSCSNYLNANTARSNGTLSVSQANQSDLVVLHIPVSQSIIRHNPFITQQSTHGNSPIPLTFQTPRPKANRFIATYTTFTIHSLPLVPSLSNRLNTCSVWRSPWTGFLNSMNTIMMLKIWSVLPDMYIMIMFIGRALAGARASSQDFFRLRGAVSSVVGGLRGGAEGLEERVRWKRESGRRSVEE